MIALVVCNVGFSINTINICGMYLNSLVKLLQNLSYFGPVQILYISFGCVFKLLCKVEGIMINVHVVISR